MIKRTFFSLIIFAFLYVIIWFSIESFLLNKIRNNAKTIVGVELSYSDIKYTGFPFKFGYILTDPNLKYSIMYDEQSVPGIENQKHRSLNFNAESLSDIAFYTNLSLDNLVVVFPKSIGISSQLFGKIEAKLDDESNKMEASNQFSEKYKMVLGDKKNAILGINFKKSFDAYRICQGEVSIYDISNMMKKVSYSSDKTAISFIEEDGKILDIHSIQRMLFVTEETNDKYKFDILVKGYKFHGLDSYTELAEHKELREVFTNIIQNLGIDFEAKFAVLKDYSNIHVDNMFLNFGDVIAVGCKDSDFNISEQSNISANVSLINYQEYARFTALATEIPTDILVKIIEEYAIEVEEQKLADNDIKTAHFKVYVDKDNNVKIGDKSFEEVLIKVMGQMQ